MTLLPQKANTQDDSSTNVHFSESVAYKYVSGVRKPISSRRDSGLYKRYKQVAKAVYGSVCRADELNMIALIEAAEKGVHFSNTERPIKIEKIVIERNLRSRRALEVLPNIEDGSCSKPCCDFCGKPGVVGVFKDVKSGVEKKACGYHAKTLADHARWVSVET